MPSKHDEIVQIVDPLYKLEKHRQDATGAMFFLHGLDSSGQGTKGRFFQEHFPHISCPDFHGTLVDRLFQLIDLCQGLSNLTLIGSSFGGLMATCYAIRFPEKVGRLILLAPALNFGEFRPPPEKLQVPALLVIGKEDTVTPPAKVIPLAQQTFARLEIRNEEDDHMLHKTFAAMAWHELFLG